MKLDKTADSISCQMSSLASPQSSLRQFVMPFINANSDFEDSLDYISFLKAKTLSAIGMPVNYNLIKYASNK
jgi:hypothetical protein